MKWLVFIVIVVLAVNGCKEDNSTTVCNSATFVFVNGQGQDLFNPESEDYIALSDFKVRSSNASVQLNYINDVINDTNYFDIGISGIESSIDTTFLEFGDLNIDTICAIYEHESNSWFIKELYYNDELIAESKSVAGCVGAKYHTITVTKELE